MKKLLPLFVLFVPFFVRAQCTVDAGEDQNICMMYPEPAPQLNGQILQGDNIVSTKWEAQTQDVDVFFWASDMLSDTTILQPELREHFEEKVTFYLTAIDNNDNTCTDSVTYTFSDWVFLTIDKAAIKNPEDTIELYIASSSNFPIVEFAWSPEYNNSDTSVPNPKVWNDTTTIYHLLLTDSVGCTVMDDPFEVYIRSTSVRPDPELQKIQVFPNPTTDWLHISDISLLSGIEISDQSGRLIKRIAPEHSISLKDFPVGAYYLTLKNKKGGRATKKVIKR